jgi:hypothetical protein
MNYLQKQNAVRQYVLAGETTDRVCDRLGLWLHSGKPNTMSPVVEQQGTPNINKSKRYGRTQNSDMVKGVDPTWVGARGGGVPGTR